ncbi:hypothetical protein JD969_18150 [Planctomycetota bacterium]|nr:hypothetical protein JD969_18150 [Planctomycetota bacterium]
MNVSLVDVMRLKERIRDEVDDSEALANHKLDVGSLNEEKQAAFLVQLVWVNFYIVT